MRRNVGKVLGAITAVSITLAGVAGCGTSNKSGSSDTASQSKPVNVNLGALPYPDDMVWMIGLQKGWDKELGLNVHLTWFTDETTAEPAMYHGSVDATMGAMAPSVVLASKMPNITDVSLTSMYQAFAVVVRKGKFKTYDDFVKQGESPQQAAQDAIKQLQGKKLVTVKGLFDAPIQSMETVAGVPSSSINIVNMDQTEGALAFAHGTGDAYIGGLPSEDKLLSDPGYTALVSSPQMGAGALYLGGLLTTNSYLSKHKDVVMKLLAMYYRGVNYLNKNPDDAFQIMTDALNKQTGNKWTKDYYKNLVPNKVFFPTYDQAVTTVYSPSWYGYWKDNLDYFVKADTASGAFGGQKLPDTFMQAPQVFKDLKQDQQLWSFINKQ